MAKKAKKKVTKKKASKKVTKKKTTKKKTAKKTAKKTVVVTGKLTEVRVGDVVHKVSENETTTTEMTKTTVPQPETVQ